MPLPLLQSYATRSKQPIGKVERLWELCKNKAFGIRGSKVQDRDYWKLVNGLLKRELGLRESLVDYLLEQDVLVHALGDGGWCLKKVPSEGGQPAYIKDAKSLTLKNVKPWVDADAVKKGKVLVAYLKGEPTEDQAKAEKPIRFDKTSSTHFSYKDGGKAYHGSKFAVFGHKSVKVSESQLPKLGDGSRKWLNDSKYAYHAVRSDDDLTLIFRDGLLPGSNLSKLRGQAFEGEGDTVLVIDRSKCKISGKGYQDDEKVDGGDSKPVAILKDTSIDAKKGLAGEELDKAYDEISDRYEKLEARRESYAKTLDLTVDELAKLDPKANKQRLGDLYERVIDLNREFDRLFKYMDVVDKKAETKSVSEQEVLDRYKKYGVPVLQLIIPEVDD